MKFNESSAYVSKLCSGTPLRCKTRHCGGIFAGIPDWQAKAHSRLTAIFSKHFELEFSTPYLYKFGEHQFQSLQGLSMNQRSSLRSS